MKRSASLLLGLAFALATPACQRGATPGGGGLVPGALAVVGSDVVGVATVERIAAEQHLAPADALDRAVADALLAADATARVSPPVVHHARRRALARALLESVAAAARAEGPPTDDEVARATAARWWEIDRPELLRTTHAVARVQKPSDDAPARAIAEKIAAATATARSAKEFRDAASAVPTTGGVEVRVEDLVPVARDRRIVDPASPPPPGSLTGEYAADFVDAAWAIPTVGKTSPVIHSEFGYHVIFLSERLPEHRVPLEVRREMLAEEIQVHRAQARRDALLEQLRARDRVEIERSAVDRIGQVKALP